MAAPIAVLDTWFRDVYFTNQLINFMVFYECRRIA